jgi:hypothetical protein
MRHALKKMVVLTQAGLRRIVKLLKPSSYRRIPGNNAYPVMVHAVPKAFLAALVACNAGYIDPKRAAKD